MKRFLISSIIFPILILTAGACAPVPTPTSAPSKTPSPVPTQTPTPTSTETPIPTVTATEAPSPKAEEDFKKYGFDMSIVEIVNKDGHTVAIENKSGKEVYLEGKFDLHFLVDHLNPENFEKTNYKPTNGDLRTPPTAVTGSYIREVLLVNQDLLNSYLPDRNGSSALLLHDFSTEAGYGYAWGFVLLNSDQQVGKFLVFNDANGQIAVIPIMDIARVEVNHYYYNE